MNSRTQGIGFGLVCFACFFTLTAFTTPTPAHANQSVLWNPCQCDDTAYTLTINTFGSGTITKSPDKTTYQKGESVAVKFTPNADKVFNRWMCTPPSHTASGSDAATVVVFMTENTTLSAFTISKTGTLAIDWDKRYGTVTLPAGGTMGDGSLTAPVNYGDTLTLTATPNTGYYTVWSGQTGTGNWSGERYSNSVNLKVRGDVRLTASFRANNTYPANMLTNTVNLNGGSADVFSAAAPTSSFTGGSYPYTTATGPARFSYTIAPLSGFALKYISWNLDGQTRYSTSGGMNYVAPSTYTAELTKMVKLNIEVEGQGVVTSPAFTYAWNPLPYQSTTPNPPPNTITPNTNGNAIVMTPEPCSHWQFDHWEYKDAAGQWQTTPGNPLNNMALTIYMNWWTGTGIHVPNGKDVFVVKAVFRPPAIHTETVATLPANRARTTIGVGEEVNLWIDGVPQESVTWNLNGKGELKQTTNPVKFTAHDQASTATITATFCQTSVSVTFNIIQPTGVRFENGNYLAGHAPPEQPWIGITYTANVYVEPDTVNFYRIQLFETGCKPNKEYYFVNVPMPDHEPNGPHEMAEYVAGKGTKMAGDDTVGGFADVTPFSNGKATWTIWWMYSVINISNGQYNIECVNQVYDLVVNGSNLTWTQTKNASGAVIQGWIGGHCGASGEPASPEPHWR